MSRATPRMQVLAERLIVYETRAKPPSTKLPGGFHVCEKLRPPLATLLGNTGFRALLARALALASAEIGWLRTVQVKADGSLDGLGESKAKLEPEKMSTGSVVLVAELLGLLVAFIGEDLTLRLVREVWPKLAVNDFTSVRR